MNEGVRQGVILSPFLFKLYIDDIIIAKSSTYVDCKYGFMTVNLISLFAVSILIPDSARFCNFCRKNKYSLGQVLQAYTCVLLHINASEI